MSELFSYDTSPFKLSQMSISTINYEEEYNRLKKEQKCKENEWKKDKAMQDQKIELYEIQLKELKEREENLRKMNDNLASALTEISDGKKLSNNGFKEIQDVLEKNGKEFLESKMKNNEVVKTLEEENKKLQERLEREITQRKEEEFKLEKEKLLFDNKFKEIESERNRLETINKQLQNDQRKSFENFTFDSKQFQSKQMHMIEGLKVEHEKEMTKLRNEYTQHMNELKNIYENEKSVLESKIDKLQSLLKSYQKDGKNLSLSTIDQDDAFAKEKEMSFLIKSLEDLKRNSDEQIANLEKSNNFLFSENEELSKNLQKLRNENKILKTELSNLKSENFSLNERMEEAKIIMETNENLREEQNMTNKKMKEMNAYIKKLESSEKSLKTILFDHKNNNTEQSEANESKLNLELNFDRTENYDNNEFEQDNIMPDQSFEDERCKSQLVMPSSNEQKKMNEKSHSFHQRKYSQADLHENNRGDKSSAKVLVDSTRKNALQRNNSQQVGQAYKTTREEKPAALFGEINSKTDRFKKKPNINLNNLVINNPLLNYTTPNIGCFPNIESKEKENMNLPQSVATALLCEHCKMSFSPNEFIEHLNFCPSKGDISQRFNSPNPTLNFQQKINSSHHQNSNQTYIHNRTQSNSHKNNTSHFDSNQPSNVVMFDNGSTEKKILAVLENINYEKKLIFDRLRDVEHRLKQTEDKNEVLIDEKENLQYELDRLFEELRKMQENWAISEEEKQENELALKNEIKFLITKLMKAKNKLSDPKSLNNNSINMSGFLNFYQQNKDNSTFADRNNDSETSMLNQSALQIVGNNTTILKKSGYIEKVVKNERKEPIRSKTPLDNKAFQNKGTARGFDICDKLDLNKYKRKK